MKKAASRPLVKALSGPLFAGFGFLFLLTLSGAGISIYSLGLLREQLEEVVGSHQQHLDRVHEMRTVVRERMLRLNWLFLEPDPFARDAKYHEFLHLGNRFIKVRNELETAGGDAQVRQALADFRRKTIDATVHIDLVVARYQEGHIEEARRLLLGEAAPAQEKVILAAESLHALFDQQEAAAVARARQANSTAFYTVTGLSVGALILVFLTACLVISRNLRDRRQLLAEISTRRKAEGELWALSTNLEETVAERTSQLQQTADRLHEAERIGRMGHWEWDMASGTVAWSEEVYRIFGLDSLQFVSTYAAFMQAVHPDDRAKVQAAVDVALHEGEYQVCHRIIRPDGEVCHVQERGRTTYDAANKPQRMLGTVRDISDEQRLQQQLWDMAHHDTLTGLPNRGLFMDRLRQAITLAERQDESMAVALIDLDYFKRVNDGFGHAAGDRLLQELARRLREGVRQSDTVARLAGDEFVGMFPGVGTGEDASVFLEKMLDHLDEPFLLNDTAWHLTTSIGVAFYPGDARDAEALLQAADAAMYAVKKGGRNGYGFFSSWQPGSEKPGGRVRLRGPDQV